MKIGICLILVAILAVAGSVFFGYRKSQTVWQYVSSRMGYGQPDANAASRIVFLGDSITAFEDWNVLFGVSDIFNAGVSGNTTDDILARLDQVVSSKPQKLFLMAGINDLLNGQDVAHVLANHELLINRIRTESPDTIIYVQSLLPINNDILESETVDSWEIFAVNDNLKALADNQAVFFIDLYPHFCGADNRLYRSYTWDGLHPNSHGYAVWKKLISPIARYHGIPTN